MKPRLVITAACCFFLFVQWYGIYFMLHDHPGALGLDDAAHYISQIEWFREFPMFNTGWLHSLGFPEKVQEIYRRPFNINKITHPLVFGILARLLGISSEAMFHANFFIGIFLMGLTLMLLFRKIDDSPWFITIAFILFAFYEGEGNYHGFFWVVPSFYAIMFFFLGIVALFYSNHPVAFTTPLILLLLITHSMGIYLAGVLTVAILINDALANNHLDGLKKMLLYLSIGATVFFLSEYLYSKNFIPESFSSSYHSYENFSAKQTGLTNQRPIDRILFAIGEVFKTISRNDIAKYLYGLYTPLLFNGVYHLYKDRKYQVLALLVTVTAGQLATSAIAKYPNRFFYPLELLIWICIAYGLAKTCSNLAKQLHGGIQNKSNELSTTSATTFNGFIILLAALFSYNAIHQKANHTWYFKHYLNRVTDDQAILDYIRQNSSKRFVVFSGLHISWLSLDGSWQNPNLIFPDKSSLQEIADTPGKFIIFGENMRIFDQARTGVHAFIPQNSSLTIATNNLHPGRYRIELIDSGIQDVSGLGIKTSSRTYNSWQADMSPVRYPADLNIPPSFRPPWYWQPDKPWSLYKSAIRPNDIIRQSTLYSIEFTLDALTNTIIIENKKQAVIMTGMIKVINLDTRMEQTIDLDWGATKKLQNDIGLIIDGKRHPLLWTGAYGQMVMRLERNFRDVKAFSFYASTPEQLRRNVNMSPCK